MAVVLLARFGPFTLKVTSAGPEHDQVYVRLDSPPSSAPNTLNAVVMPNVAWLPNPELKTVNALRPDIVHTHTSKAGYIGRMAAAKTRVPIVVHTPHGHIFFGYFNRPLTAFYTMLERRAAEKTDRLIELTRRGVEQHIAEKGHLPNIPPACDMQENGISVGEMQTKMMEKIEELTLYLIDLKKENETLKRRVQALEITPR